MGMVTDADNLPRGVVEEHGEQGKSFCVYTLLDLNKLNISKRITIRDTAPNETRGKVPDRRGTRGDVGKTTGPKIKTRP